MNNYLKSIIELLKVRITFMVLVTTYLGYYLGIRSAGEYIFTAEQLIILFNLLFGTFMSASGASILNQVIEVDNDAMMDRTKNRPIPTGRIKITHARLLGRLFCLIGVIHLYYTTNTSTARHRLIKFSPPLTFC